MEPTQAKPIRKRRRWLVGAPVLALVSLACWWYWPRGDARFVGKWIVSEEVSESPSGLKGTIWTLRPNGTGRLDGPGLGLVFLWHANGEFLYVGDGPKADPIALLDSALIKLTGYGLLVGWRFKVMDVGPDTVRLEDRMNVPPGPEDDDASDLNNAKFVLTRIPE